MNDLRNLDLDITLPAAGCDALSAAVRAAAIRFVLADELAQEIAFYHEHGYAHPTEFGLG